ncbi:FAD-dependent oxidoreductase [Chelativorans xinjiangense]|uniref:FAD-dependent oxidoreductase n=1 Tax=Chelativorans xinjiangense TaxID=2681485 RepID=UPI00135BA7AC
MIRAAEALHGTRAAPRFPGLAGVAHLADWQALVAAKDELVASLRQKKYLDLLTDYDAIDYIDGTARFNGAGLQVNDEPMRADSATIATGASPARPDIPGIEDVPFLTSTSALELDALPRSLLVVGGGYIGCELAQMFGGVGFPRPAVTTKGCFGLPAKYPVQQDGRTPVPHNRQVFIAAALVIENGGGRRGGFQLLACDARIGGHRIRKHERSTETPHARRYLPTQRASGSGGRLLCCHPRLTSNHVFNLIHAHAPSNGNHSYEIGSQARKDPQAARLPHLEMGATRREAHLTHSAGVD